MDLDEAYSVKTPQDSKKLYASWAATYNETFIKANDYVYPLAIAQHFAERVATADVSTVIDIGCGTGAVGSFLANLRPVLCIDGFDISPEMLAEAAKLRRIDNSPVYNRLVEVDLTAELPLCEIDAVISAGTFTHGHLGPDTLINLLQLVHVGGWFVVGINSKHFVSQGFGDALKVAFDSGKISQPECHDTQIYGPTSPHFGDLATIATFRRTN